MNSDKWDHSGYIEIEKEERKQKRPFYKKNNHYINNTQDMDMDKYFLNVEKMNNSEFQSDKRQKNLKYQNKKGDFYNDRHNNQGICSS